MSSWTKNEKNIFPIFIINYEWSLLQTNQKIYLPNDIKWLFNPIFDR